MRAYMLATAATAAAIAVWHPAAQAQESPTQPSPADTKLAASVDPSGSAGTQTPGAQSEDIIVTGTRQQGRTKQQSPAPVDVISGAELAKTGEQNVFDALNKVLPSFDVPPIGFDLAGLVRSARLRGLSPDDTLVLVDGKRRHISAQLNALIGPVGGSDPVDLDMIPISLIDHIEVLRDGAAAQYGSDAIAGVVNIILKHADHGTAAYAQEGATYVQDGFTNNVGVSQGFSLGGNGFFDIAGDYRYHDHTNRGGNFPSEAQTAPNQFNPPFVVPNKGSVSQIEGDPRYNLANVGYNMAYTFSPQATFYSFATYGYRHSEAFENYRDPNKSGTYTPTAITAATPFGNLTAASLYPYGFEPLETISEDDYAGTVGIKGDVLGDWHYDVSTTYGADVDNLSNIASINSDYLHAFGFSPTHFHTGEFNSSEWTTNLDISKPFDVSFLAAPLNVAFGGDFRHDTYGLRPGDGPSTFGGGSQAFPGFTTIDAGYFHRNNEAGYIDVATYLLPHWQIDIAGRYEHYSDVVDTETGKITTRYDFSPQFGIRGTISNGFRAPTLAQEGFATVNVGPNTAGGQFPVNSAAARALGSTPLKPERSQNYEVGIVAEPIDGFHLAIDAYQISIRDQIVDSGLITGANALEAFALSGALPPSCGVNPGDCNLTAQFFTNGIKTQTRGADVTIDYVSSLADYGKIAWLFAANFNDTELKHVSAAGQFTPDVLSEITEDNPKSKLILQGTYTIGPFSALARVTRYGQSVEVLPDANTGAAPFTSNRNRPAWIGDLEFGYKVLPGVTFTVGANNFTDKYAAHSTAGSRLRNAILYIPSSPYGIDGGFYYGRVNVAFGAPTPPPPSPIESAVPPPPPTIPVRTYLVFFDWDRADLTERARQIVSAAAQASTHVQTTRIEVNGYTDLSGTVPYNQKLSVRRARTVEEELVRDGVARNEIAIHGYGESNPLVQTARGVREPQNRRVEILLN